MSLESKIYAKLVVLVPSQIRGVRLALGISRQSDLAKRAKLHQSRIAMLETPGYNPTLRTLAKVAAGMNVGIILNFVPLSEMLRWENEYSQDAFAQNFGTAGVDPLEGK